VPGTATEVQRRSARTAHLQTVCAFCHGARHREGNVTSIPQRLLLPCLGAAVLVGCSSHHATRTEHLAPPVIREGFTRLGCPATRAARQTTIGVEGCLEEHILRTDREINNRVRSILRLAHDRTQRQLFVAGEEAWHAYRQKACKSEARAFRGGTAQPAAFADCVLARNRSHLRELVDVEGVLTRR
jgi:uncharacterized protein YecT (DUF1311 family)